MGVRAVARTTVALSVAVFLALGVAPGTASARTKSAGIVSADSDANTNAVETLLSSIPSGDRERCYEIDKDRGNNGKYAAASVGAECDAPADGIDTVLYFQYSDPAALATDYAASYPSDTPPASSTTTCDGTQSWTYHGQSTGGDYACFADSSTTSQIVWTATDQRVLGLAGASDGAALVKWWNGSSGPLQQPDTVTNFAGPTKKEHDAAAKALLAGVGQGITKCSSKLSLVAPGDAEWAWYAWLQAAEACDAPQHGSVYLAKLDPASVHAYETYFARYTIIGDNKSSQPKACADQNIRDDKKKVVGSVGCLYAGKLLYAVWYTTDDGVMGGVHVNTTPKQLFAYLNQNHLL
jgi:hypothetical protein